MTNRVLCAEAQFCLQYKQEYSAKAEDIKTAIQSWNDKLAEVVENRGDRTRWIDHFAQFSELESLDRSAVARLIQSVIINADKSIDIRFNFQDEYQKAMEFVKHIYDERRVG